MQYVSLNGTWKLYGSSGDRGAHEEWPREPKYLRAYDAPVPGTVQEALEFVTGDLTKGHNVYNARFIEECRWMYTRTVEITEEDLKGKQVRLVFSRLDLVADVYVNGWKVGSHNNFYTPYQPIVTEFLKPGENQIAVVLESGLFWASDKPVTNNFGGDPMRLTRRIWLRKPQSSFEWDWSPRLANVGVYDCGLEFSNGIFRNEPALFATVEKDGSGDLELRQYLQATEDGLPYRVQLEIPETGDCTVATGVTHAGENCAILKLHLDDPEKWYVRGYGPQKLYEVKITVFSKDLQVSKTRKKVGFRTVEIDQSEHPDKGNYFILKINGEPVFAKGANMIPADILFTKLTKDTYRTLIERAKEANFNALRVWGGGLYETDEFYELCNEEGFVVWQDFVNACANYPGNDHEFYRNYESEVRHTIRRLSSNPSLVIYAGNNEIDWQMQGVCNWGLAKYTDAQLYYWLLPKMFLAEGETRYYQPSSPWSFDHTDANSPFVGDQHPWSIGFGDRDYWKYRTFEDRFPNEGGILGPTSLPCMMECLGEGMQEMHSFDWSVHDNSIADKSSSCPDQLLEEKLGMTTEGMPVRDYVYYGGFLQGEGLSEYILNYRRRMYSSSSAIFWMYEDCWPAVRSWTIVDYLRNRTPSFHPVRRAFAPVCVNITKVDGEDRYLYWGINERPFKVKAKLEYGVMTTDGRYQTYHDTVVLNPNASVALAEVTGVGEDEIPYAILTPEGEPVSRRRYIDKPYQTIGLKPAEIRIRHEADGSLTYTCDCLTLGVCLDLDGRDGGPSDNFFDLFPGKPYTVQPGYTDGSILFAYQGNE